MPRVLLDAVTKVFESSGTGSIRALSELSLSAEDRECLAIVGPSGSGKTTALRLIAGLETPTSGTISLGGHVVNDVAAKERDVAMVFQSPALYPHMSVYENLEFGLRVRGYAKGERDQRVKETAEALGLNSCLRAKPMELSGGQRQRVAIGRALVRRPGVLLLDEPLANVDPTLRAQMRSEITELRRQFGTTMIYVTHDHQEALMIADRVAVLCEGVLQQVARPFELYSRPANLFVGSFVGSPPMNQFRGVLIRRENDLFLTESSAHATASSPAAPMELRLRIPEEIATKLAAHLKKEIILGLRPEHIARAGKPIEADNHSRIHARIISVQNAGPDHYVRARFNGTEFVARVPSVVGILPDQELPLELDTSNACFFDPVTGRALC